MTQAVIFDNRAQLRLSGADARPLLQGLVTVDLDRLTAGRALYGALLTPQGKFLFDFHIVEAADGLLLDTSSQRLSDLERRLKLYRLRAAVTIEPLEPPLAVAAIFGGDAAKACGLPDEPGAVSSPAGSSGRAAVAGGEPLRFVDPRLRELGVRAYGEPAALSRWLDGLAVERVDALRFERHRIGLAVPEAGVDLVVDKTIMLEAGLDQLGAVAFDKGCFVGQELTARTHYRGLVKRRLVPLELEGAVVEPGFAVMAGEREAGEIRSVSGDRALALLRLDRLAEPLEAGGGVVRPRPAPWQGDLSALIEAR